MQHKNSLYTPKKLGQHFLQDRAIAQKIVTILDAKNVEAVIEVGAGRGALTDWLVKCVDVPLYLVEVDKDLALFLKRKYDCEGVQVVTTDFLKWSFQEVGDRPIAIVGNFPYNISSQIFWQLLTRRHQVKEVVGMVQYEVAQRFAAEPGNKTYGKLSVLLQAFYDVSYCFSVPPAAFQPRPKVTSGVVHLLRNKVVELDCDEALFYRVVKAGFQQRRKMLRNSLMVLGRSLDKVPVSLLQRRPETLGFFEFVSLTKLLSCG